MFGSVIWKKLLIAEISPCKHRSTIFAVHLSVIIFLKVYNQHCPIYAFLCLVVYQHDYLFGDLVTLGMFYCFQHIECVPGVKSSKNLFMVSARFCEINFILQVLLYTFKCLQRTGQTHSWKGIPSQWSSYSFEELAEVFCGWLLVHIPLTSSAIACSGLLNHIEWGFHKIAAK